MASVSAVSFKPVDRFFEFSLLGLLASGFLAVAGSGYAGLDLPTILIVGIALLLRAAAAAGLLRLNIPAGVVTAVTLAYVVFCPFDYFLLSPAYTAGENLLIPPAVLHLIFFVAVVKILTAKTSVDFFLLKVIAFLELLAACVLSYRSNFFIFLLLFLILGVATFASGEIRQSRERRAVEARIGARGLAIRLTAVTLVVSTGIMVITAVLFFFLPRTASAAFRHLVSHRYHLAGFSNHVTLGEIGEIKKENTPVMHVKMDHAEDRALALKWRGASLAEFNGRTWSNPPTDPEILRTEAGGLLRLADDSERRRESKHISYAVHLNEAASDALFFAGSPQFLRIDSTVIRHAPDNYSVRFGDSQNIWYQVYSRLDSPGDVAPSSQTLSPAWRKMYLQLPHIDPRIVELTQTIVGAESSPAAQARLIEKYLHTHYGYTLELPPSEPADPLSFFLFHRRKGHCEYFASAMTVMLRTLDIPSRVVTGFQSGVYNPISGTTLIRTSDAHSWVEAWVPHRGWATYDPTPPDPNPPRLSIWTRLGFYADAAEVFWQDWVLNYNLDRQLQLATRMGESSRHVGLNWFDGSTVSFARWRAAVVSFLKRFGFLLLGIAILAFLGWQFGRDGWRWWTARRRVLKVQRGEAVASDATLFYDRMLRVLKRRGIEKPAWLTPFEFARTLQEPKLSPLVADFTGAYNELRFGGNAEAAGRIMQLLERLESV